jgi:steroid delta-isomerase-like uncharacterized protein
MQQFSREGLVAAWTAAWDRGAVDALDDLVSSDYVRLSAGSQSRSTLSDLKSEIQAIREGFPDLRTVIESVVVGEDSAAIFWASEGTHSRPFLGVPPTGKRVRTTGSNHLVLRAGRIVTETVTWDAHELLASLGVRSLRDAMPADEADVLVDDLSGDPSPELLKGFNRQFVTGVTVVTTCDEDDQPKGLAVNSYASISLEPPLVLVSVQKTSSTYATLFASTHLGINILSADQLDTVGRFSRSGVDKFAGLAWHAGPAGSPLIDHSAAALEAEIRERFQAKTHTIFVCRVRHAEIGEDDPMIYRAGKFFHSADLRSL